MTVLAMEGFEHGNISSVDQSVSLSDTNISTSYGRFGGNGLILGGGNDVCSVNITPNTYSTIYVGFALKCVGWTIGDNWYNSNFINLQSGGYTICGLAVPVDYYIGLFLKTGTGTFSGSIIDTNFIANIGKWDFYEISAVIHATAGSIVLKRNGEIITNLTGLDTDFGYSYFDTFMIRYANNSFYIDDIYITDDGFLGDVRIRGFVPDSNGSTNNFTPSAGSNYQCVDETPDTDDTDYVSSNSPGDIDLYGITTGALADVKGIQVRNSTRKDDAGTREVRAIVRSNGSNYNGDTVEPIDSYSGVCKQIWETDPDDSNAWTQTKLEAAEFGLEIVT